MNLKPLLLGIALASLEVLADELPFIFTSPQGSVVATGSNATFSVVSTNATAYQWRFNGVDLSGGTNSTLIIANAQSTSVGYYLAIAKNGTGWTPSQMAYLSVVTPGQGGRVPFSNLGNSNRPAGYQCPNFSEYGGPPITNGTAQIVAGPRLDQMFPTGTTLPVNNGFFSSSGRRVPNVAPGELVWFRVDITYPCNSGTFTQQSTTLSRTAGTGAYSSTESNSLYFPTWPEWPEPLIGDFSCFYDVNGITSNQTLAPGESFDILQCVQVVGSWFGIKPEVQWRKDGTPIPDATNNNLTIMNFQIGDVGVYDIEAFSRTGGAKPGRKFLLSIQTTNGQGVLRFPRILGSNFVCDLEGIQNRHYSILCSSNLSDWTSLLTFNNDTGVRTFTNAISLNSRCFYRSLLLLP